MPANVWPHQLATTKLALSPPLEFTLAAHRSKLVVPQHGMLLNAEWWCNYKTLFTGTCIDVCEIMPNLHTVALTLLDHTMHCMWTKSHAHTHLEPPTHSLTTPGKRNVPTLTLLCGKRAIWMLLLAFERRGGLAWVFTDPYCLSSSEYPSNSSDDDEELILILLSVTVSMYQVPSLQ